jgi:pSer/pThr/pTyr-binding forkhead associated (FHA) protein
MTESDRHAFTPIELQQQIAAVREQRPFLLFRDGDGAQQVLPLDPERRLTIGREAEADLALGWDPQVSRVHAQLECVGGQWTVVDDGLSRNGSFVNGERIAGRRRLADGDSLRLGRTQLVFRVPGPARDSSTVLDTAMPTRQTLSEAQRRVLVALCRPYKGAPAFATPATNAEIAAELVLSVDAVKTHMRALFGRFGVEHYPQNQKRARLVEQAFLSGLVSEREL